MENRCDQKSKFNVLLRLELDVKFSDMLWVFVGEIEWSRLENEVDVLQLRAGEHKRFKSKIFIYTHMQIDILLTLMEGKENNLIFLKGHVFSEVRTHNQVCL